jgi:8-oxo-dGTP pyrophosphatase MutT (NUDIX family)
VREEGGLSGPHDQSVNVYDEAGRVTGVRPRAEATRSSLAVGAVNVLLVNGRGEVLLQRRPDDKENGGRWDKTVGGHVDAGESFDETAVREAGEELFGDGRSPRVRLAASAGEMERLAFAADLTRDVVFRREALQLNLRDVRLAPGGGIRNVVYHVATYLGRTEIPLEGFRPPADEIAGLRYAAPAEVDAMLVAGQLSPNMGFLWLTHARALLALPGVEARRW